MHYFWTAPRKLTNMWILTSTLPTYVVPSYLVNHSDLLAVPLRQNKFRYLLQGKHNVKLLRLCFQLNELHNKVYNARCVSKLSS